MLTESVDPFGNSIRYYYEIVHPQEQYPLAKTIYPSSIEYTGHYDENQIYHSGKYEIRFNRQGIVRPDIITSCNYGFEEENEINIINPHNLILVVMHIWQYLMAPTIAIG